MKNNNDGQARFSGRLRIEGGLIDPKLTAPALAITTALEQRPCAPAVCRTGTAVNLQALHSPFPAMTDPVRLAKRVAEIRACSRREAEQTIAGGWVRVDGVVIEEPQFRVADQRIEIDPLADPAQTQAVTLLLHKPPGYRTSPGDESSRSRVVTARDQMLGAAPGGPKSPPASVRDKAFRPTTLSCRWNRRQRLGRLHPRDWRVARKLTRSRHAGARVIVEVAANSSRTDSLRQNQASLPRKGSHGVRRNSGQQPRPMAHAAGHQGHWAKREPPAGGVEGRPNRTNRAPVRNRGLRVVSMKRIRLGRVPLAQLPPGQWRYLCPGERF